MDTQRRFKVIRALVFIVFITLGFYLFDRHEKKMQQSTPDTVSWEKYENENFSIRIPSTYATNDTYTYQALGPGKDIAGVSFTIPSTYTEGTNLSTDSYLSVEQLVGATCSAEQFLFAPQNKKTITENDVIYSYADSAEPAAGNLYDERVYVLTDIEPCTAVRYFIHSGNIYNYEPGTVKEFDKTKILAEFDVIRATLVVKK